MKNAKTKFGNLCKLIWGGYKTYILSLFAVIVCTSLLISICEVCKLRKEVQEMANINKYLEDIKDAKYGEEVRDSIIDAIDAINTESNNAMNYAKDGKDSAQASATKAKQYATDAKTEAQNATNEADRAKTEADRAAAIAGIGVATTTTPGIVKPDGTTITVDPDGTIHGINIKNIIVVGKESKYKSINAAITEAKKWCSLTNRALILIAPGTYEETITLHPNPGIDMLGYGAKIISDAQYPDTALYTNGTGTFVGITFQTSEINNYAVHVERDDFDNPGTPGKTVFRDCNFYSMGEKGNAGAGCGMTPGSDLKFWGCKFYSLAASGIYLHNAAWVNAEQQNIYCVDCIFEGKEVDVRIDDAVRINGGANSPMRLTFRNCSGKNNKVRFWKDSYNPTDAVRVVDDENIKLVESMCWGNSFPQLNNGFINNKSEQTDKYIFEDSRWYPDEGTYVSVHLPYNDSEVEVTNITVDGSTWVNPVLFEGNKVIFQTTGNAGFKTLKMYLQPK